MSDERTGRELTPRPVDRAPTPAEDTSRSTAGLPSTERFYAGDQAHTVGMTEERAAQIVRQTGNARSLAFLGSLFLVLFIPLYWFYDIGLSALGVEGRMSKEEDAQYVTDVARGYELYLDNCARCHGADGRGGIGPALNDPVKLENVLTADGLPGTGHLNPNYLESVLREGGRIVCGNPDSLMPPWLQPNGPFNYRQVEEVIAFLTASNETTWTYQPAHPEAGHTLPPPREVSGWRDPNFKLPPQATPFPECWSATPPPARGSASPEAIENPGTEENPRVIELEETASTRIVDPETDQPVSGITVQQGETVEFRVTNSSGMVPHNFYIGPADTLATAGERPDLPGIPTFTEGTQTFTYTVEGGAQGELQFACTVPGHYGPMHGDLVVVAGPGDAGGESVTNRGE